MKPISNKPFLLFSILLVLFPYLSAFGQVVNLKSGSIVEKRVLQGQTQEVKVNNTRGQLQWQQSDDGVRWHIWSGKTDSSVAVVVTQTLFLRCAIQEANCERVYSDVLKLAPFELAAVITKTASEIQTRTATSGGHIDHDGGDLINQKGVCWSLDQLPEVSDNKTTDGQGIGSYSSTLSDLSPGRLYYVRAYAVNSAGISYGNQVSFLSNFDITLPSVITSPINDITSTDASGGGHVIHNGYSTVTARGLCWSTSQNPTTADSKTTDGVGSGLFTGILTGLTGNTDYYVRAYCTNVAGTSYGNQVSFKTSPVLPTVSTAAISAITQTTASSGGNITSDGGTEVISRGIYWSTNPNPASPDSMTSNGPGTGIFISEMTGLTGNTVYYVLAYATNREGTAFGNEVSFLTSPVVPTVTTSVIEDISQTTASSGGIVLNDGGAAITERGICWSTSQNPSTSDSKTSDGSGLGTFSSTLSGMTGNTTYYIRAYSTNSAGTSYGNEISFKTSPVIATVTTAAVLGITQTTASSGGNITSDGGAEITSRGICWSTSHNPSTSDEKTSNGFGAGSFSGNLTGLTGNTTYYIRAYATNSAGTSYGNEVGFKTSPVLPTLTTIAISSVSQTTAYSGGNITSDGGAAITDRGVCWSITSNPTTASSKTSDGTGAGAYASNLSGMTGNTTYYVRAYSTNSAGTSYGNEISFKTSPVTPTVTTAAVASITQTTAFSGGNITSDGGADISSRGICWSISQKPVTSDAKTSDGSGLGSYASSLTGLTGNTTYFIRAYSTNIAGTSYGNEISFKTSPVLPIVTTSAITSITQTTASSGGNITSDGGAEIADRGICWSTNPNPTVASSKTTNGTGTGTYSSSLTGLTFNTTYYVRAFATNSVGTSYGNEVSARTSPNQPTVATIALSSITQTTAISGGNITSDGGGEITDRGICWSTSQNPVTSGAKTSNGSGIGTYTSNITGLTGNTTYYVRAYATNSAGTSYGNEVSSKTSPVLPEITTSSVSAITQSSASAGGNITNDGGAGITQRGVCWSTSNGPTIANTKTSDGTGTGAFKSTLSGLAFNTTYYIRAYATNSAGTSYGSEVRYTTGVEYKDLYLGFFVHYSYFDVTRGCECSTLRADLKDIRSLDELADNLDINDLVATAVAMRAQYMIFTTFHSNMNVLYPSPVMKKYLPGHSSKRDVIAELITALKEKNIRLILYYHPSDGYDFNELDQSRTGWSDGAPYTRWNNFTDEFLVELVDRYGSDVSGYFMDGGLPKQVDAARVRKTIKDRTPNAWIIQNGRGPYDPIYADYGMSEEDMTSPYPVRSFSRCQMLTGEWWAEGRTAKFDAETGYRYTVLQAAVRNRIGGGVAWSFSPYPGGKWEAGVQEFSQKLGPYIDKAAQSLFGTRPGRSWLTSDGQALIGTRYASTESPDGKKTYLHVFIPPGGQTLELPAPADNRSFKSAYLFSNNRKVDLQQTGSGVSLTLNAADSWDSLDTIIVLE